MKPYFPSFFFMYAGYESGQLLIIPYPHETHEANLKILLKFVPQITSSPSTVEDVTRKIRKSQKATHSTTQKYTQHTHTHRNIKKKLNSISFLKRTKTHPRYIRWKIQLNSKQNKNDIIVRSFCFMDCASKLQQSVFQAKLKRQKKYEPTKQKCMNCVL